MKPFLSSGPVVGSKASGLQSTPHNTMPFSSPRPVVGSEAFGIRSTSQSRFNDPSVLSCQTSNIPPTDGPFQHYQTPYYLSTVQVPLSHTPNMVQQPIQPTGGQVSSLPASLLSQVQIPSGPKGSPPRSINHALKNINVPQSSSDSLFSDSRPYHLHFPGYVSKQSVEVSQVPPIQSPFLFHQESCAPAPAAPSSTFLAHQGGYVPPLQVAASLGLQSMEEMQYPGSRPTTSATEGLMEDINVLFIGSFPGSVDPGFDPKELPRPLDGDKEPKFLSEKYPMNCNPRYLQLTTSVIPNSQSLASRWHLPLGAVVCPLAEAPIGVSVDVLRMFKIC